MGRKNKLPKLETGRHWMLGTWMRQSPREGLARFRWTLVKLPSGCNRLDNLKRTEDWTHLFDADSISYFISMLKSLSHSQTHTHTHTNIYTHSNTLLVLLTNGINKKNFAGIDPIGGDKLSDEDLVGTRSAIQDLKSKRQVIANLSWRDVVSVSVETKVKSFFNTFFCGSVTTFERTKYEMGWNQVRKINFEQSVG